MHFSGKSYVVSFSAHADCQQTTEFIQELQPRNVILVHGNELVLLNIFCFMVGINLTSCLKVSAPKWKI
jgi:predicted metal-dependent RNase